MFKKVCIIGCGLIGSSIARGIKKNKLATKVVSSNRSNSTNKKVIRLKIVNEASSDTKKIVKGSDLIIISSPLSSYKNIILKIKSSLKNGAILTDVGSVKKNVISLIEKNIPKNVSWISSHPIAGTEESGPESGFSELFKKDSNDTDYQDSQDSSGLGIEVGMSMKEAEKRFIFKTLHETKGNRTHAAKTLGISIRTLRNKLNEYREEVGELELEAED